MKIVEKIQKAQTENTCFWSFEYFPPKTEQGVLNLYERMQRMYELGPMFIDVTWGAGGTTSDLTLEICSTAQSVFGLETQMHLTCTNMPREKIDMALAQAKSTGIRNILALRGDPPRGIDSWVKCETGFAYASDLVRYIREQYGDYFCIAVAGYPEGHIDNPNKDDDLMRLKDKVDAGADLIVTQLFYECDIYLDWVQRCRSVGIICPILPGIMPIQNYAGFKRMTSLCKTFVPQKIYEDLEPIKDDDQAVKNYGVQLAVEMCNKLKHHGALGFHFYTLNLEKSVRLILEKAKFVSFGEHIRPLPWVPSLAKNRENENVRPIFWKNRARSYVMRTESWDEFPNGRWGDSRSPAFGELDGYGMSLKFTKEQALGMWEYPQKLENIVDLFAGYCSGDVQALPWCDSPLSPETEQIREQLVKVNRLGFLTINSQPAVNGAPSNDTVYGWGPRNGYCYQKVRIPLKPQAYLEFFVHPAKLDLLLETIDNDVITYHAVNKNKGDLRTNNMNDGPNAVTWGIFPGKEVVQPTIVEEASFMAWKDEAFELWKEWAKLYDDNSTSRSLLEDIAENWFLVNIVNNDFKDDRGIFRIFEKVETRKEVLAPN